MCNLLKILPSAFAWALPHQECHDKDGKAADNAQEWQDVDHHEIALGSVGARAVAPHVTQA